MSQLQRPAIRRIRLEKMKDAFPEKAALQPLLKHVGSQDVGDLLQKVSAGGLTFHFHAQPAQAFHPSPYRRSRDANLFRDSRAADYAGGIFRKQREQSRQPPVSRAR